MIQNYKMVLTNSAIIINDYNLGDCPTLERTFKIWDPVCHTYNIIGMYYDEINKRLYLPRGSDVSYVKRKLQSTSMEDITSTVDRAHNYGYTANIKMKKAPRNERQMEALQFMLCKDKYNINSGKSQFSVNLSTGMGKTYCATGTISYLGIRTAIITAQSGILEQWKQRLKDYTDISMNEIVLLEGSAVLNRILNDQSSVTGKSIYLITHSTLQQYGTTYGWDKVGEVFKKLGIGIKIFDEAHQNFVNMAMIDFFTNTWRTYYLTATPKRSSKDEDKIYQIYMKNIPSISLFDDEIDPHTKYIAMRYNSNPRPMDIINCRSEYYGLNHNKYIAYLMTNERFWIMFDYIFNLIYRAGGRALFYIGTNDAILKVRDRILLNYPELINQIGVYTSISEDKPFEKTKKYILTTTKSAGAGEDIAHLKYSVVLAEPFKSEVLTVQSLGRTRDPNTIYLELVDVGFKQLVAYYNAKKPVFKKYATSSNQIDVSKEKIYDLKEETRIHIRDRFKQAIRMVNIYEQDAVIFNKNPDKLLPAVYFDSPLKSEE